MIDKNDWLPVGSIVRLKDAERDIMVAGYMLKDGMSDRYWDYVGYPFPEGKRNPDVDYFFNKDMIEEIKLIGYLDGDAMGFMEALESASPEFEEMRKGSGEGEDTEKADE